MARLKWTRAPQSAGFAAVVALAVGCQSVRPPPVEPILPEITLADPQTPRDQALPDSGRRQPTLIPGQGSRVQQPQVAEVSGGGFMVNLSDADLAEATRVILGDLLGASFTIDPGVQGRMTLSGATSLSRADLLALYETALRQNGAVLLRQGEAFRVSTLADAQGAGRLLPATEPGYGVTAVPLRFMGADAARTLLEGTLLRAGAVRTEAGRNLILVTGTRAERAAAIDTLASFDVDWIASMSVGVFPVENADPESVITELEAVFQTQQGGVSAGALRLRPLQRLSSILVIGASPEIITRVGDWIARLDVDAGDTTVLRSYFLDSGKAEETARLLTDLFTGSNTSSSPVAAPGEPTATGSTLPVQRPLSAPATPRTAGQPRIIADKLNNALLVLADPSGHRLVQRALLDVDRQPSQVLVDATIVEVTLSDRLRYGVQFFFETNGWGSIADSGRGGLSRGDGLDIGGVFPGFNFLLESGDAARVVIDALSAVTNVSVRSSPSLMVMDNQSATLNVGDQVPLITRQAANFDNGDNDNALINQIEYKETGVSLTVTPRVSSTGMVTLDIEQIVSSVSQSADTGTLTPTISKREITSTVAVRSGQTLVLGGLIDEASGNTRSGVPLLSSIPVIGNLFSSTDKNARRTELIVFLTPRVVRNDADVNRTAVELRDKMDSIERENSRRAGRP